MKTLFFDLDGTLLNTHQGIVDAILHTLNCLNAEPPSATELNNCIGPPIRQSFTKLLNSNDNGLLSDAVTLFRQYYLETGIYHYQIYAGIESLLQQLNTERVKLQVLTVKPQKQAEIILADAKLNQYFHQIHGSEDSGVRSSKSGHLGLLLREQNLTAQQCYMIGDRASDIQAAHSNDVHSVAVYWGYGSQQELDNSQSSLNIRQPQQLLALL